MKFKKRMRLETGLKQIDIAPLIDCVFLLLIFFLLTSSFIVMPGINVKLPKAVTSDDINVKTVTVAVSSEDIIYVDTKVMSVAELEKYIKANKTDSIFIRADKDASMGTIVAIWDICKRMGIEKLGIATTQ
ncbi:MAG: biopolymer transporter ExbD [Candidatus Omnitrophica bacterium]|nr:biopolymer transporter ExbD [Candidatus Omnitrophota bacterium]MDD5441140.1 biopolymer transporter ExbD [Candidatus Omnitrophota bacterium]